MTNKDIVGIKLTLSNDSFALLLCYYLAQTIMPQIT